jgi:hypothetical protein
MTDHVRTFPIAIPVNGGVSLHPHLQRLRALDGVTSAMMRDRKAVSRPDQAEKASVKVPKRFELNVSPLPND